MIKFRENYDMRSLDFAFPHAAVKAVFEVEMKFIERGVYTRSVMSGPLRIDALRASMKMSHRIMLIDSKFADEFVEALEAAVAPFTVAEEDFGDFGKDTVEA